jgi:N-acetyl-anhydromuramyl-L-alanine amidase AmpD
MAGNIIGEPIKPIIGEQVRLRQLIQGSGYNENSISRSPEVLNFLNNKNSWIKLASGVSLDNDQRLKDLAKFETSNYFTENDIASLVGPELAKNYILFNSIQGLTQGAEQQVEEGGVTTQTRAATYSTRSGVRSTNSWNGSNNKMYGGMGGNSRGLQPVPGITGISVESVNRGSIRKATVTLKAFNKFQFGIIEILYLRLGYIMMLEWGWDKYIDSVDKNNKPIIKNVESTIIENSWFKNQGTSQLEMLQNINIYVDRYKGNYQGFFVKLNNFTWTLNADNTYDITVNLISLGSVIESLQVVVPSPPIPSAEMKKRTDALRKIYQIQSSEEEGDDNPVETNSVITNLGSDRLSQYIAQTIETFFTQKLQNNKDFCFLPNLIGAYDKSNQKAEATVNRDKVPVSSKYYIRFGKLLEIIEDNVIFRIVNGPKTNESSITFEKSSKFTRINYEPNLIPLDPSIAIFKPVFTAELGITDTINVPSMKSLKDFVVENDDVYYGELMNIYLNLDWVSKTLSSNKNEKNELDLFNFMQKLLGGIDKCMGNITSLTTSVKNDKEVYFLDENPIPGYDIVYPPKYKEVEFNIIGYTPNSGSSFVTDFNFQTKITPKLMTQISIGATAAGSQQNSMDAVGYKTWNKGLTNRYEEKYENGPLSKYVPPTAEEAETETEAYYRVKFEEFAKDARYVPFSNYFEWTYLGFTRRYKGQESGLFTDREDDMKDSVLIEAVKDGVRDIDVIIRNRGIEVANEGEKLNGYTGYLLDAFGGTGTKLVEIDVTKAERKRKIMENFRAEGSIIFGSDNVTQGEGLQTKLVPQVVSTGNALYWYTSDNSDFIERGYSSFKLYKSRLDQFQFEESNKTTGATGFIPVTLGLTFEGLGGIQIYNKLKVNQKALPASYPSALKFIVDGLNHSVNDNKWVTNLTTISQPRTTKPSKRTISPAKEIFVPADQREVVGVTDVSKYTEAQKKTMTSGYSLVAKNGSRNGLIYAPEETPKIQFVVHHTAGLGGAKAIIENSWTKKTSRVSTHFIIDRAGNIEQLFPLKYWGNHIGSKRSGNSYLQKSTISVELVALGYVKVKGTNRSNSTFNSNSTFVQSDKEYSYEKLKQGQPDIPVAQPYYMDSSNKLKPWGDYKGYGLYHSYTKRQLASLEKVMKQVQTAYPNITMGSKYSGGNGFYEQFPKKGSGVASTAFNNNRGTFTHNSYRTDKSDVFPQKELLELFQKFNK